MNHLPNIKTYQLPLLLLYPLKGAALLDQGASVTGTGAKTALPHKANERGDGAEANWLAQNTIRSSLQEGPHVLIQHISRHAHDQVAEPFRP